jgi:hypothetical protein
MVATPFYCREAGQTWSFRGTKSRNKVTVGEPAVGSLQNDCQVVGFLRKRSSLILGTLTTVHCTVFWVV